MNNSYKPLLSATVYVCVWQSAVVSVYMHMYVCVCVLCV